MSKSLVVFGSSKLRPEMPGWEQAMAVGRVAAESGYDVVSGGYQGAMEAASLGARGANGRAIGITTAIFADREPSSALDEVREEPDYQARLAALLRAGDAFVALPGGLGTASEWVTACCLASIGELRGRLFCFVDPWRRIAESLAQLPEVAAPASELSIWIETADELRPLL